ncbi:ABC transporter ATP-binding protein [Meridianimarinicoccus roseus]|uniref:ABC transporter ATP-binding protein n=1 Tax=Meridianimarinicoccus roseus TaxID=2072018 RepID=A0A2V2LI65_9RHOB|nr:ATP-binding cassette domain-containing protein [Meridianimarinicoccus roseus]PWR03701.1 ABC transporter ATP-binding protein [Meridianimarinicoccus roseus]
MADTEGCADREAGPSGGLALRVSGLTVRSPRGRVLLSLPSLELPGGTLLGVRGPSGAGKSTLLHALAGLSAVAEGTVRWGDTDLSRLDAEGRARFRADQIGMIFQDFLLFDELSAQDNAALPALFRPRAERAGLRARAAARLVGLGLSDTARSVASYSGGERQRVAIARALAAGAPVLLADEPTASLDRAAADRLIADLTGMARAAGTTLVAVSHDERLIARMDRVLTLADGAPVTGAQAA